MVAENKSIKEQSIEELLEDSHDWSVNTGGETIHARRMPGTFRLIKTMTAMAWLAYFLGPYLRWDGHQAIFLDVVHRKFHFFEITILPQDVWMLSLILLFFAILLAVVTSIGGRIFCGYFCFQTVWTDLFTWIEEKIEGKPNVRRKAEKLPLMQRNVPAKVLKHAVWILIGALNGIAFTVWFGDAFEIWWSILTLDAHLIVWAVIAVFASFTYLFAGWMREQVCFWLCPYARIQGVMMDTETLVPTYDLRRGEPRGKLKKGEHDPEKGDCVNCNLCLAVCPTGVDIRSGQQEGCITCGLCIDACNSIMDKIGRPRGLVRYMSYDELSGKKVPPLHKRPRPLIYITIMFMAAMGILYGLTHLGELELRVLHERQPLFVQQSDGSIQNKYELKILNKTPEVMNIRVTVSGLDGVTVVGTDKLLSAVSQKASSHTIFMRVQRSDLKQERQPVTITVQDAANEATVASYESMFFGPK